MSLSSTPPSPHPSAASSLGEAPVFSCRTTAGKNGGTHAALAGVLTVRTFGKARRALKSACAEAGGSVTLDLAGLERMDTNGALLLNLTAEALAEKGRACTFSGIEGRWAQLLEKSRPAVVSSDKTAPDASVVVRCLNSVGGSVYEVLEVTGRLIGFLGQFLVTVGRLAVTPNKMRWTSLIFHMEQTGLRAAPIVGLLTFLIGLVVAYMGAQQLTMFGAQIFAVNLLEVTVLREMAVLITSIVVAGRSSSSFTAQIGAMVANEEVAALRSMGLDPMVLLVVPRVLALMLCLPLLVFLADIMALFGGAMAIWYIIDMDLASFITQLKEVAGLNNFLVGMSKTPFFAVAIGLVGCFQGLRATGSAESVGFLTTIAVVQSIFLVIVLDALFAIFYTSIGI